jgi:glucosamine-6-phosphate deaminase
MPIQVIVTRDFDHLSEVAAELVVRRIRETLRRQNECVLGLATGNSPTGLYKHLAKAANRGAFDSSRLRSFNLDEYVGLPGDSPQQRALHPESYGFYMVRELFGLLRDKFREARLPGGALIDQPRLIRELRDCPADWREVGADTGRAIIISPRAKSAYLNWVRREILDGYARRIRACGGVDLQVIGCGGRGHVAFHEVGIPFRGSRMLLVRLDDNTVRNAVADRHFASLRDCPRYAVSMGAELVYQARTVLLLACGARKTRPVADSLLAEPSPTLPISYGQSYAKRGGDLVYLVDVTAGAELLRQRALLKKKGIRLVDRSRGAAKLKLTDLCFSRDPVSGRLL